MISVLAMLAAEPAGAADSRCQWAARRWAQPLGANMRWNHFHKPSQIQRVVPGCRARNVSFTFLWNRPCARASQSRCQHHRKRITIRALGARRNAHRYQTPTNARWYSRSAKS